MLLTIINNTVLQGTNRSIENTVKTVSGKLCDACNGRALKLTLSMMPMICRCYGRSSTHEMRLFLLKVICSSSLSIYSMTARVQPLPAQYLLSMPTIPHWMRNSNIQNMYIGENAPKLWSQHLVEHQYSSAARFFLIFLMN